MAKYVWCEDSASGFDFWRAVFRVIAPEIIVQTKMNNSELRKAVSHIRDDENMYYIIFDGAMDNPEIIREQRQIKKDAAKKNNVVLVPIHSFEFTLLSFDLMEEWVFAENAKLRKDRQLLFKLRKTFVNMVNEGAYATELTEISDVWEEAIGKNSEQIASKLLYYITRNTGFETTKSEIGPCFVFDCCVRKRIPKSGLCGLNETRLTSKEKIQQLVAHSVLRNSFEKAGII